MILTRYELEFYGEPQCVGFIQGLKDQGIDDNIIDELIKTFDKQLAIPEYSKLNKQSGKYIASFFTKKGLTKFEPYIRDIILYIKKQENGFDVIEKIIDIKDVIDVVYMDDNQVLINIEIL